MRYFLILFLLICSPAWSATQLKKTVCPSGCDYTSLESCMNANEQNLVTADKYFDVEISGTWSSADTTAVTIHNYTTDATRYINVYTTGDARHDGRAASVSGRSNYRIYAKIIDIQGNYITIDGIEIYGSTGQSYGDGTIMIRRNGAWGYTHGVIIDSCIVHDDTGSTGSGINCGAPYSDSIVRNNIIYNYTGGYQRGISANQDNGAQVYNNTVYNCGGASSQPAYGYGIGGFQYLKNNIAVGNGGASPYDFFTYTSSTNKDYNISTDSSASGSNSQTGVSASDLFVSITPGSEDLHLKSGVSAIDAGTDLSATFTTDIDGQTRSGTWDIGADEFVSGAPAKSAYLLNGFHGVGVFN